MPHCGQSWDADCVVSNVPLQQIAGFKLPKAVLLPTAAMTRDGESLDQRLPYPSADLTLPS